MIKKLSILLGTILLLGISTTLADDVGFEIIPKGGTVGSVVESIQQSGGQVWENYKDQAYGKVKFDGSGHKIGRAGSDLTLGEQFASGIMNWDTILDYATYLVKFLGQLALLVGALMIIYLGYKKATEHIQFNKGTLGKVIIGVLVVIFAYVIVKTIWSMFVS